MNTKAGNGIVQVLDFENDQQVDSYTKTSKFITCTLFTSSSNCKLSTIEGIRNILAYGNNTEKKYKLDQILTKCRIVTYINTNLSPVKDFIENNYELYESIKIPVGYSGGYQYHLFIRNSLGIKNETMRPTEINKNKITKDKVKTVLSKILKQKKRKTDYIDEFLNLL